MGNFNLSVFNLLFLAFSRRFSPSLPPFHCHVLSNHSYSSPHIMGSSWSSWLQSHSAEQMKKKGVTARNILSISPKLPTGDRTGELLSRIEKGELTFSKFKCVMLGSKCATLKFMRGVMNKSQTTHGFPEEVEGSAPWKMARIWVLSAWEKKANGRLDFFVGYVVMHGIQHKNDNGHMVKFKPCEDLLAAQLIRNNGLGYDADSECYRYLCS